MSKVMAFEVEIEVYWSELTRLPGNRTREVWVTPARRIMSKHCRGAKMAGVFNRDIGLADFREACFAALEEL